MHTYVRTDIFRNITDEVLNSKTAEKIVKRKEYSYPVTQ